MSFWGRQRKAGEPCLGVAAYDQRSDIACVDCAVAIAMFERLAALKLGQKNFCGAIAAAVLFRVPNGQLVFDDLVSGGRQANRVLRNRPQTPQTECLL